MTLLTLRRDALQRHIDDADIIQDEQWVNDGEHSLYVRRKRSKYLTPGKPPLLMVHGSTYPAEATFDLPIGGVSMLDILAAAGVDAWMFDIAGYGASSRPDAMAAPAAQGDPVSPTRDALRNLDAVVRHVMDACDSDKISLLGWSWGTTIMGAYTAAHPAHVERLVQLAPQWLRTTPSLSDPGGTIGAYREVVADDILDRWLKGVPEGARDALIPTGTAHALKAALLAADHEFSAQNAGLFRAPNGTVADSRAFWAAGKPVYEPSHIRCPVLIVHGEWDQDLPLDMTREYFGQLRGARYRKWVEVSEATHSLILERNRMQVVDAVIQFLAEDYDPGEWQ